MVPGKTGLGVYPNGHTDLALESLGGGARRTVPGWHSEQVGSAEMEEIRGGAACPQLRPALHTC